MRPDTRKTILQIALVVVATSVCVWCVNYHQLTGSFFPLRDVESLHAPVLLAGWTEAGLTAADGHTITIPGIHKLPSESKVLTEFTQRGVEIAPDGHLYVLARIHHWCGNDPMRTHIARVDLSDALMFLHVGQPDSPVPDADMTAHEPGGSFSKPGWNVSEFLIFEGWQAAKVGFPTNGGRSGVTN